MLLLTLAVAGVDWAVKAIVVATRPVDSFVEVPGGRVALWHVHNHAMMLGLWESYPLGVRKVIAAGASLLAFLIVFQVVGRAHRLRAGERRWAWTFAGLAFGGMLGNLGERVIHWWVTDYLSLRWGDVWLPPGNVADLALFVALPMALPVMVFELRARMRRGREARDGALAAYPAPPAQA